MSTAIVDTSHEHFEGIENGEVAPKDWIFEEIENQTLQSFWRSLLQIVPEPVDPTDVQDDPFWLRYEHGCNFLKLQGALNAKCEPISD
jgi:hypothetical protein